MHWTTAHGTPNYVSCIGNCESIKQVPHAVKVLKRFKRIDPEHKSEIIKSLFRQNIR